MTVKQAVAYNFLSSTTCYIGFALGVFLGEYLQNTTAIFALAGGMFLYIALVDMVSENKICDTILFVQIPFVVVVVVVVNWSKELN